LNRYAKLPVVILVLTIAAAARPAHAMVSFVSSATGVVSMTETVTSDVIGPTSYYKYSFDITNISNPKPIWWFLVYTNANPSTLAMGLPANNWGVQSGAINPGNPQLTGPAGDPYYAEAWTAADAWPNNTPDGVQLGQTDTGFWFLSTSLDTAPLLFVYDQEGDWSGRTHNDITTENDLGTNDSGDVIFTGGGHTAPTILVPTPEPSSLAALAIGAAGILVLGVTGRRKGAVAAC
jgi:hypothetical protein